MISLLAGTATIAGAVFERRGCVKRCDETEDEKEGGLTKLRTGIGAMKAIVIGLAGRGSRENEEQGKEVDKMRLGWLEQIDDGGHGGRQGWW